MRRHPAYFHAQTGSADRWMDSYLDISTILLILFVAIAAHSMQRPRQSVPVAAEPLADTSRAALLDALGKLKRQGLNVTLEPRGLVIALPHTILYRSGSDQINREALPILEEITFVLREMPNRVSLVGHADTRPIHTNRFHNNWELSMARGMRLLEVLAQDYGIPESRLSVGSASYYHPAGSNDTESGRAANRRVEIVVLKEP